jgi:hypothetical protein
MEKVMENVKDLQLWETEEMVAVWKWRLRDRLSEETIKDLRTTYYSKHWRDKYVLLLPHIEEIKGLC